MDTLNCSGLRATIFGLGREGAALARFLEQRDARVTVTDASPPEALTEFRDRLEGSSVRFVLGGHPPHVLEADLIFVSPGVPMDIPPSSRLGGVGCS